MKKILLIITLTLLTFVSFNVVLGDTLAQESEFNNITIFIRFNDESWYSAPYDYNHYDDMLNSPDTISLKNYYLEASYGSLTINSYIPNNNGEIIFYTDIYDREYFEPVSDENPNGVPESGQAEREHNLIKRAINYVDDNNLIPDDMNLDVNEDGEIDSLTFMISGEDTGWNTLLWPHKWQLHSFRDPNYNFLEDAPTIDGVNAYIYTWELLGWDQDYSNAVDVGVLAHETFHLLGAPDLYHYYNYLGITPVGNWGLMEYNGEIPSHMLGYMKERYGGWATATEITESGTYTLYPLQDSPNNMYKIYTGIGSQWIYLEYRDNEGFYEYQLPDTGLLVYRANMAIDGNANGSYDEAGIPTDEVWIFRPGMDDVIEPIIIEDAEGIDGKVSQAALNDDGRSKTEMGIGTEIPIFASDGTILNISITNVQVHPDGYVTFDVFIEPQINIVSDNYSLKGEDLRLYDSALMEYEAEITNIADTMTAYYTTDGTTPTMDSTEYVLGSTFPIDSMNNIVKVALYEGSELVTIVEKEYQFSTTIESDHYPYGNHQNYVYYIDFGENTGFSYNFVNDSFVEDGWDFVTVDVNGMETTFTGSELSGYEQSTYAEEMIVRFESDEYLDDFYGFKMELDTTADINMNMLGESEMTFTVFEEFIDPGTELTGADAGDFSVTVNSTLDINELGTYTITYELRNSSNEIVYTVVRTVHVVDDIAPVVSLIGESEIDVNLGEEYIDQYINFSDNYDTELTVNVEGEIDNATVGIYTITYTVIDSSGNETVITRTVNVVDVIAPEGELLAGVDTLRFGEDWIDGGVSAHDNYSTELDIVVTGEINNEVAGDYPITYTITDESGNIYTVTRIVTVLEATITDSPICDDMITTLSTEDVFELSPCYLDGNEMQVDQEVFSMNAGVHDIEYYIEIDGIRYEHTIYYYVYQNGTTISEVAYIERRRYL